MSLPRAHGRRPQLGSLVPVGKAQGARCEAGWQRFVEHALSSPGRLPPSLRRDVFGCGRGGDGAHDTEQAGVPADLALFADAVANRSYQVTDDQVTEMRADGWSEDQVFEAIVAAAVGAASVRRDAARQAMDEANRADDVDDAGHAPRDP
jgi:hypothetical protein